MQPRSAGAFLLGASLTYLLCLWLVSGLWPESGLRVFLAGLAALAFCWQAFRRGRPRPLFVALLGLLLATSVVGALEAAFRLAPGLLRGRLANHVCSGYHTLPGGIYRRDAHLGHDLRPSCRLTLQWNGHWWRHETNEHGYRGPAQGRAEAVFLGDSMVYGHGVQGDQTVPSRFSIHSGLASANLGQQGTCLVQMWLRHLRVGVGLRPRLVFACSHPNDVEEVTFWYPEAEARRFVAQAPPGRYEPLVHPNLRPKARWKLQHLWADSLAPPLRTGRVVHGLRALWKPGAANQPPMPPERPGPLVPARHALDEPFDPSRPDTPLAVRLGWQAHRHALAHLKDLGDRHGARLVLFDLGYPLAFSRAVEALAGELGAEYNPAGRVALQQALAGEDVYLANDGHWSPPGCDLVARELARSVRPADREHPP